MVGTTREGTRRKEREMIDGGREDAPLVEGATGISKRRFFMLLIVALNMVFCGMQSVTLAPVNNIASEYYGVSSVKVEWLNNIGTICQVAVIPASYFVGTWGIRKTVMIAVFLNLFSTVLQYPGYRKDLFALVMASRVPFGIAFSTLLVLPAKISAVWFAKQERATATGVSMMSTALGGLIGNLLVGFMIKEGDAPTVEENLKKFYTTHLVFASLLFLLVFFFKEKPRVPPSLSCERESVGFLASIETLLKSKNSLIMIHSAALNVCATNASIVLLNPLITSNFRTGYEKYIGLMSAISLIGGVLSMLAVGFMVDKYQRYKPFSVLVNAITAICWLSLFVVLTNTRNFPAVFVLFVLFSIFSTPYTVLYTEAICETFYPISEEKIAMVGLVFSTPYSFLTCFGLGVAIKDGHELLAGYLLAAICFFQVFLVALTKVDTRRSRVETT